MSESMSCFAVYKKMVWIPRLGSELMVGGIDVNKFTFCSTLYIFILSSVAASNW